MHVDVLCTGSLPQIHVSNISRDTRSNSSGLLVFDASVKGFQEPMKVLIDSGASENFIRRDAIKSTLQYGNAKNASTEKISVRLANGEGSTIDKIVVPLQIKFEGFDFVENFIVLDLDKRHDIILGMPWLIRHQPWIDWMTKSIGPSDIVKEQYFGAMAGNVPYTKKENCSALQLDDGEKEIKYNEVDSTKQPLRDFYKVPNDVNMILELPELTYEQFLNELKSENIVEIAVINGSI